MSIDQNKCGAEYSLCLKCKHQDNYIDKCQFCTRLVSLGYDFLLSGIPVGTGITFLHQNFEPIEKGDNLYV